jgi:xanthine dehydrogenase small subunit
MSRSIRFLLNRCEEIDVVVAPDMTVLNWLRLHRALKGTKEGCAEGDCGACTVALADVVDGKLVWHSANACIMLMGQLHHKMLVSVEGLAHDDLMHPVQQAMVEHHASQCGFCTPGFVMSLFGAYHSKGVSDVDAVHDQLAGNLCRCTGYRPIIDAAMQSLQAKAPDYYHEHEAAIVAHLTSWREEELTCVSDAGVFHSPQSLEALDQALAASPQAVLIAGGTDIGLHITKHFRHLDHIIALNGIDALKTIEHRADGLMVGSAVSYERLLGHVEGFDASVQEMLRRLGSRQIRSLATLGGNIANASPIGDIMPLLLALNAQLILRSRQGERICRADEFNIGYRKTLLQKGEYIARIFIPYADHADFHHVTKMSRRYDQDISIVCGAIWLRRDGERIGDVRLGFGGMAAVPQRARHVEAALRGQPLTSLSFEQACAAFVHDFTPLSDLRAHADYRMALARAMLLGWGAQCMNAGGAA